MRRRRDRPPGPSPLAVLVLGVAGLVMLATSAPIPTLESEVIGEAALGPNAVVEHELRMRISPQAGSGTDTGTVFVTFLASSGLDVEYTTAASVGVAEIPPSGSTAAPVGEIPLERCRSGCDLVYTVTVTAGPEVLPGSVARYRVGAELTYQHSGAAPSDGLHLALEGVVSGPPLLMWAVVGGVLALIIAMLAAPWVDARLGARRRWPARALTLIPVALLAFGFMERMLTVARHLSELAGQIPSVILFLVEPWSLALFGTLLWGLVRGLRRWDADGGWLFGVAAVGLAGLGGLYLAWRTSVDPISQPMVATIVAVALGALAGVAIGQAWRTDPRAAHDRWWAGLAVLAHGIVILGFVFIAVVSLEDPFGNALGVVLLLPAALIALALQPWFDGGRVALIVFDTFVAIVGVLGALAVGSMTFMFDPGETDIQDVAIALAVVASIVAFVTAWHRMPRRDETGAVIPPGEPPATTVPEPPGSPADVPATT